MVQSGYEKMHASEPFNLVVRDDVVAITQRDVIPSLGMAGIIKRDITKTDDECVELAKTMILTETGREITEVELLQATDEFKSFLLS